MSVANRDIVRLYKNCLVYINTLKYSDKSYLKDKIRQEFRKHKTDDKIDYYYNKGESFLKRGRFL